VKKAERCADGQPEDKRDGAPVTSTASWPLLQAGETEVRAGSEVLLLRRVERSTPPSAGGNVGEQVWPGSPRGKGSA
jgi:hypothetical protein